MTSHLNSHRTTDIKPEMLSGVQTGNGTPHDKYDIRDIAHTQTKRKDNIFMQRRLGQNFTFILEWGQGACSLTKPTQRWAYSRYLFPACCLLRFAAFFFILMAKMRAHEAKTRALAMPYKDSDLSQQKSRKYVFRPHTMIILGKI